jgi:hypothetical protein
LHFWNKGDGRNLSNGLGIGVDCSGSGGGGGSSSSSSSSKQQAAASAAAAAAAAAAEAAETNAAEILGCSGTVFLF